MPVPFTNVVATLLAVNQTVAAGEVSAVGYTSGGSFSAYFEELTPGQALESYGLELRRPARMMCDVGASGASVGDRVSMDTGEWSVMAIQHVRAGLGLDHDLLVLEASVWGI